MSMLSSSSVHASSCQTAVRSFKFPEKARWLFFFLHLGTHTSLLDGLDLRLCWAGFLKPPILNLGEVKEVKTARGTSSSLV